MKIFQPFCFSFFMMLAGVQAQAASITNLDTKPYDILTRAGGDEKVIHLEPNRTWRTATPNTQVRYRNRWKDLNEDSSYAIWTDGTLSEQTAGPLTRGMTR